MKIIRYTVDMRLNPHDKHPVPVHCFLPWSEENEALAKGMAYDGKIRVAEMQAQATSPAPTLADRIALLEKGWQAIRALLGIA